MASSRDVTWRAGGPAFPATRASHMVLQSAVSGSLIKSAGMATKQKPAETRSLLLVLDQGDSPKTSGAPSGGVGLP